MAVVCVCVCMQPNVFLEAFPNLKPSCGDSDCIPTLTELLQGSAAENRPEKNGYVWVNLIILGLIGIEFYNMEYLSIANIS